MTVGTGSDDEPPRVEVGLVSDTHGLLRPGVLPLMEGCDLILHAGDVGESHILEALGEIAPVTAVRGSALPAAAAVASHRTWKRSCVAARNA